MEILYLPDPQREMSAKSSSFLSSQKLNLQLEEGWKLTEVSGESDSSVAAQSLAGVLEEMTQGASDIASAVLPIVASRETPVVPLSLEPGLYRILIQEDGSVILRKAEVRCEPPQPGPP